MSWTRNSRLNEASKHCNFLSLPFLTNRNNEKFLFFTDRDSENRSYVRCASIISEDDRLKLKNVRDIYSRDIANTYESNGVCAVSCIVYGSEIYLFCSSWYQDGAHFLTRPLLLVLDQASLTLQRKEEDFLLAIQRETKGNIGYYCVFKDEGKYKAIFESRFVDNGVVSFRFKMAISTNLQDWSLDGDFGINPRVDEDYISRPSVIKNNDEYLLAYSSKVKGKYHIEVKKSSDCRHWTDMPEMSFLILNESNWENDEVCYPFIFLNDGKIQMLYNGNGYGKSGAGLATWNE